MAKKPRTPPPPRQQGPRQRGTSSGRGSVRPLGLDQRGLLAGIAAGAVVGVIVLVVFLTRGGGGGGGGGTVVLNSSAIKQLAAAGCVYRRYPSEGRGHVSSLDAKVTYKTFPPTSGTHYVDPLIWNRYTQPISLIAEVHNLEHGGVIVQYGDKVPKATVDQLVAFYDADPNGMLLAPLPKLRAKIALTAWTRLATCTRFDNKAYAAFRDAFRGKGPERVPVDQLTPGAQ